MTRQQNAHSFRVFKVPSLFIIVGVIWFRVYGGGGGGGGGIRRLHVNHVHVVFKFC